jgi:hypothetical protein
MAGDEFKLVYEGTHDDDLERFFREAGCPLQFVPIVESGRLVGRMTTTVGGTIDNLRATAAAFKAMYPDDKVEVVEVN